MSLTTGVLVALAIFCAIVLARRSEFNTETYVSERYPISFRVHREFADRRKAVAKIERLMSRTVSFLRKLREIRERGDIDATNARAVENVLRYFNPDVITENDPNNALGDTSYVVGQGIKFALCLRQKDGSFVDDDVLFFVTLHELTHVAITDDMYTADDPDRDDHSRLFWETFSWILRQADAAGALKAVDYSKNPVWYCGMYLDNNPMFI